MNTFLTNLVSSILGKYAGSLEHAVLLVVGLAIAAESTGTDAAAKKASVIADAAAYLTGLGLPAVLVQMFLPALVDAAVTKLNTFAFFKSPVLAEVTTVAEAVLPPQ